MEQYQDIKSIVDNTYSREKYQIDKEYNNKLTEARSDFAARGAYHSGAMIKTVAELEKERVRKLYNFYFNEFMKIFLLTEEEWNVDFKVYLKKSVLEMVESEKRQCETMYFGLKLQDNNIFSTLLNNEVEQIKKEIEKELETITIKENLGMYKKELEGQQMIKIEANESVIANLNLGTIMGNVSNNLYQLKDSGFGEIAEDFKRLLEEITNSKEIPNNEKSELVEQVEELTNQAKLPTQERKRGVVKSLLNNIGNSVLTYASLASIWLDHKDTILKFFKL